MQYLIRKPEKENEAAFLVVEHAGMTAFADINMLVSSLLGLLLAALLPAWCKRVKVGRGRAARRRGSFGGRSGAFGGRGRR